MGVSNEDDTSVLRNHTNRLSPLNPSQTPFRPEWIYRGTFVWLGVVAEGFVDYDKVVVEEDYWRGLKVLLIVVVVVFVW